MRTRSASAVTEMPSSVRPSPRPTAQTEGMTPTTPDARGPLERVRFLISGATSASGLAVARALVGAGHGVVAAGRREEALAELRGAVPGVTTEVVDLTDLAAVRGLRHALLGRGERIGGVVHLVGGWLQSEHGIADQSDDDWGFLEGSLTSLRRVSRVFVDDVADSARGRFIAVSSTAVDRATARMASYVAIKAASDAWMRSIAQGFAGTDAAAAVIVASQLAGREQRLGELVVDLAAAPASVVNGQRVRLDPA